ncbi:hypothetical protein KKE06_04005, partial [Candidatus Micrarchaeota archaeon]|nr:hypothetical protein [Candidatus Micrarchaeota archaeon]MBU1930006.1 hypothetical protein [Candidatus Micrarchaeota archaeon]
ETRGTVFYGFSSFFVVMSRGKLIAIEGTDSSGKATQAKLLVERLQRRGFAVELVNLPRYHEFFGGLVGRYLAGEFGSKEELPPEFAALLYSLDRYHLKKELEHKLDLGITFVFDRYTASNLAHQAAKYKNKKEQERFVKWINFVEGRLPKPSATIFFNLPEEAAQKLMNGKDRKEEYRKGKTKDIHEADIEYLKRTRIIYKRLARKQKWVWIDVAFKDGKEWVVRSKEEISEETWKKLVKKMVLSKV